MKIAGQTPTFVALRTQYRIVRRNVRRHRTYLSTIARETQNVTRVRELFIRHSATEGSVMYVAVT